MEPVMTFLEQSDWVVKIFVGTSIVLVTVVADRCYELLRTQRELGRVEKERASAIRTHSPVRLLTECDRLDERGIDLQLNLFEARLRRFGTLLGLIAVLAPMLGLVGTFLGVFQVFEGVSDMGLSDPKVIAGGIRKVLVDTVAGLALAIPAMVVYKSFEVWALQLGLRGEALLMARQEDAHGAA